MEGCVVTGGPLMGGPSWGASRGPPLEGPWEPRHQETSVEGLAWFSRCCTRPFGRIACGIVFERRSPANKILS
ncbi:hypothetical protein ACSSS7_001191 [Eimeria intestinalis]